MYLIPADAGIFYLKGEDMIKSKNKIKVILTTFGTIEVLELPLQLHKDSFNNALIQVLIPITEDRTETSFVKIYGNTVDSTGAKVWNSQTYSIYYKTNEVIDKFEYAVYEDIFPEEFSTISGDLNLTISYADLNEDSEAIDLITSQPLHLFINGEGYNQNGVQISQYDATVSRINLLSELSVLKLDISKDLPLGIVFNKEGFKSPFYRFYTSDNESANLDYVLPINSDSTASKQCSIVANSIVKDTESPEVIGYQTEFAFFEGGVCQRTNKYNISQGSISNYVLLESGEWEIANQDYITLIKEQADQNSEDIETLYRYYNTGTNYLGEYPSQSTMPTDSELNQYVQTNFNRAPQNGDEMTFVLLVEDGTDVVYMIKYSEVKATWTETPLPAVEPAKNGTMGIIQGTGEEELTNTRKVLVDVNNGEISDILHANESGTKESVSSHLNRNSQNIAQNASDIEAETGRAESAEETLTNNLNAEINRATTAESSITEALNDEITRATNAENVLETSIENEITRATTAEHSIAEDLEDEISRAQQAEQTNATAIANETTRATNAENSLDTDKLDKSNINANYLKDIVFSVNGDNGVATLTLNNPVTGQTQSLEITVTSPASSTNTGLMTAEMVQALNTAIEDIESLKYIGKQIASFQTYADAELFDFSTLSNVNENDYFIVYEDESRTEPAEKDKTTRYVCIDNTAPITIDSFQFSGVVDTVLIQVATETELGGVLSTNTNGYIYVENTGAMKLVGYDNIISSINNLTTAVTNETTRATSAEEALSQAITTETTRAQQAEQENASAISAETTRAQLAEQANASAISAETQRAQQAEQENADAIETKANKTTTVAGKPLSADVSLGTLTIKQNNSDIGDYNGETDKEINITTPTATSDLTNNGDGTQVNGANDPYAKVSQIPTNNNQLTNGAGYTKITINNQPEDALNFTSDPQSQIDEKVGYVEQTILPTDIDTQKAQLLSLIYPIGSIYMSVNNVSPQTFLGGTWEVWGNGRVPLAIGNNGETNYTTAEQTGGSENSVATHNHTQNAHYHNILSLDNGYSANAVPSNPQGTSRGMAFLENNNWAAEYSHVARADTTGGIQDRQIIRNTTATNQEAGITGGNRMPFITCYMWKRIA